MDTIAQCARSDFDHFTKKHPLRARLYDWLGRKMCGLLGGHTPLPKYDRNRISLVCTNCGHQTPGWELTEVPPRHVA